MAKRTPALLLVSTILTATCAAVLPGGSSVRAAPGTPGVPGAPTLLYVEDFENGTGVTELESYVSDTGVTYTADSYWLRAARCNGFILAANDGARPAGYCNASDARYGNVRSQAHAVGLLTNPATAATNRTVSSLSTGNIDSDIPDDPDGPLVPAVMFRTVDQLDLPTENRFVAFSVDVAASFCAFTDPLLRFYTRNDVGTETPVSATAINPCTDPNRRTTTINGLEVSYGSFAASTSQLLTGESLGIVLRNEALDSYGNDAAFDNIRVLDVSPQLDRSFSPASVAVGGVSTLTFTITNTTDLLAKNGWGFTQSLPEGLTVATPAGVGGTCDAATVATPGGSTITVTGGVLSAGQVSCTITVDVTSSTPGPNDPISKPYQICWVDLSNVVGLNLPNCAGVEFHSAPSLSLAKSASPSSVTEAGETITYSFLVTNNGTATLSDIGVDETEFTGTGGVPAVSCPVSTLAPGAQTTCTATYTATQADVNAGRVENVAVAYGTAPGAGNATGSPPDDATVTASAAPALTVDKSVSPSDAESFAVGQLITYSFVVTNTGNVTMSNVSVNEGAFTGAGDLSPVTCGSDAASLAPGAQVICTATYTIVQADVDAGGIDNDATATGTPPSGPAVESPSDEVRLPATRRPQLTVTKTADKQTVTTTGEVITYSFLVTNSGNVTMTDIDVRDTEFSGTGALSPVTCPVSSLVPGETTTCTATYSVMEADLRAARIDNGATVLGTPPGSDTPVESASSRATVAAHALTPSVRPALINTGVPDNGTGTDVARTVAGVIVIVVVLAGAIAVLRYALPRRRVPSHRK
ncbi:DUF7507 domain-containing protein [Actinophytocola sp.]|uniref:DUF7507 domain-containing protein n=1 Tax=Actinophytocola sp. TaxID=1872138 RepID=UPI002ED3843A